MSEETGNVEEVSATDTQKTDTVEETTPEQAPSVEAKTDTEVVKETGTESDLDSFEFNESFGFSEEEKKASLDIMRSFGVTNKEQAQKVVDFLSKFEEEKRTAQEEAAKEMLSNWDKTLDSDQEFSKNYDANMMTANKALSQYASKELTAWLTETGFNRNPEVVKMFYRIGKDLEEAKVLTGNVANSSKLKHDKFGQAIFTYDKSFGDR